jgi:hypothetical protein
MAMNSKIHSWAQKSPFWSRKLMARNRTQSNRQDGRPQRSCTHERLHEEVERCEGVSAAPNGQEKEACRAGNQGDAHSIAKKSGVQIHFQLLMFDQ